MSKYIPKPGKDLNWLPGWRRKFNPAIDNIKPFDYKIENGKTYAGRFGFRFKHLSHEFNPSDPRNKPVNSRYTNPFTEFGKNRTIFPTPPNLCIGGADCCDSTGCYDVGGCNYGRPDPYRPCDEFCQDYYDIYGEEAGGCPEAFDSACQECFQGSVTDKFGDNLPCYCGQSKPPGNNCWLCNPATGAWITSAFCKPKEKPPKEECICYKAGCKIVLTTIEPWDNDSPCPSYDGYRNIGRLYPTEQGGNTKYCFYCSASDGGEVVCENSVTGKSCCPSDSTDECLCQRSGDSIKCTKACDPDTECDPPEDDTKCTLPGGSECAQCEYCDELSLICMPDPGCGTPCGGLDEDGKSKSCSCNGECDACDLCNDNGRCYPNPDCDDCLPPI